MKTGPRCLDCAHYAAGWFGRHLCRGFASQDPVTGIVSEMTDTCGSMRASGYAPSVNGFGGASALCGPEARLFMPKG